MAATDDTSERITRMKGLVDKLSDELDSVREEGRVISSALKAQAVAQQVRARAARLSADAAQTRAIVRETRTHRLTRHKRG
jgi:hypothetical protein